MEELIEKLENEEYELFKKIMNTQNLRDSEEYKTYSREHQILIDLEFQAMMHLNTIMSYRIRELKSQKGEKNNE